MKHDLNQHRRDAEIARNALGALRQHADVRHDGITVSAEKGWVTLEGYAKGVVERSMVESVARCIVGVKGITNRLAIARPDFLDDAVPSASTGRWAALKPRWPAAGSRSEPHRDVE